MSAHLSPDVVLEMIPELAGARRHWQALPGGLTNRNYKVDFADQCFVLRLDDTHTSSLGLDRATELKARNQASEAGLAARVIFSDSDHGILLSEYLPGRVWGSENLRDPHNLESLATLLHKVHALPLLGKRLDPSEIASRYLENLAGNPVLYTFGKECQQLVSGLPADNDICCCHNDVIAGNIVAADRLSLLDWEYACDNSPMFDLASLIAYHGLDAKMADILLNAYAGGVNSALRERLENQVRLFDALQWLWFAVKQCSSPDGPQAEHLHVLRQRIESRRL